MTSAQPSIISVAFTVCRKCGGIMAGDTIYVVLPGFSRPEYLLYEAILPGGDNAASFGAITWDQASETLTLTVSETLRESREYQVDVPLEAGLRLPYKGVHICCKWRAVRTHAIKKCGSCWFIHRFDGA
jgi:hypothetical protein